MGAPHRELRALRTLATQVPLVLHGVSLGLASCAPVDEGRLGDLARVIQALEPEAWSRTRPGAEGGMSAAFEAFLARIYVDAGARERFLADPRGEAGRAGLSPLECDALDGIDRTGLALAARSFERKRARARGRNPPRG